MKRLIALIFIIISFNSVKAQQFYLVSTPTVLAQNAANVKVVTKVSFGNFAMPINQAVSVDNVNKKVNLVSCYLYNPLLPSAPIFIDTINVGILSIGNYDLNYTVFISSQMTVCAPYDTTANSYPFSVWESTNIGELNPDKLLQILPNPATDFIEIKTETQFQGVTLYDLMGNCLQRDSNQKIVDLTAFPAGVYILSIECNGVPRNFKVIKR